MEVLGLDGVYEPYYDIETERIEESATTRRSIVRTYNPGPNGEKQLVKVEEEETRNTTDGVNTVRTTSNADLDGNLEIVERELATTTHSVNSNNTQTTVYLKDVNGKLAPSMQTREQQEHGTNGDITTTITSFPDVDGRWQVYEVREQTIKGDAHSRTMHDRLSRRDFVGNVSPVSEVTNTTRQNDGQVTTLGKTSSIDVAGMTRYSTLHLTQQSTTVQSRMPERMTTEHYIEQLVPGDSTTGLSTVSKLTDIITARSSGTVQTSTVVTQYPDGYPSVVSVYTRIVNRGSATQVIIIPTERPLE